MSSTFARQHRHMCSEIRRFRRSTGGADLVSKEIDIEQVYRDAFFRAAQKEAKEAKKVSEDHKKDVVVVTGKYLRYYSTASIQKYYAATGTTKFVDGEYMSWATNENATVTRENAKAVVFVYRGLPTF